MGDVESAGGDKNGGKNEEPLCSQHLGGRLSLGGACAPLSIRLATIYFFFNRLHAISAPLTSTAELPSSM